MSTERGLHIIIFGIGFWVLGWTMVILVCAIFAIGMILELCSKDDPHNGDKLL
jgi:hypothetical protein